MLARYLLRSWLAGNPVARPKIFVAAFAAATVAFAMGSYFERLESKLPMRAITAVALIAVVGTGIFLRGHRLTAVLSDYDDIGVVALHKAQAPVREEFAVFDAGIVDVRLVKKDDVVVNDLLDTPFFGPYISYRWTYPPGQYLLYPLVMSESDSHQTKLLKGRIFSLGFSILALGLFTWLCFRLNDRQLDAALLLPVLVMALSINMVLYAKHMGPYSLTVAAAVGVMWLFLRVLEEKLSLGLFISLMGVLSVFNYLTLIMLPPLALMAILRFRLFDLRWRATWTRIRQATWGFAVFAVIFAPLYLVVFKPQGAMYGVAPPPLSGGIAAFVAYFPRQFTISASSALASFSGTGWINVVFVAAILIPGAVLLVLRWRSLGNEKYVYGFAFLLLLEWVTLHASGRLIMDQTRHALTWVPLFGVIMLLIMRQARPPALVSIAASIVLLGLGLRTNLSVIDSRQERFDHQAIMDHPARTVLAFHYTLDPLVYFPEGDKRAFYIDENYFGALYDDLELEDELLLVSRYSTLADFKRLQPRFYEVGERLYEDYEVDTIREVSDMPRFVYETFPKNEPGYGMYVYQLTRKRQD